MFSSKEKLFYYSISVRNSDPLGRRCGAVARAARACRRCARGALQYSPTALLCGNAHFLRFANHLFSNLWISHINTGVFRRQATPNLRFRTEKRIFSTIRHHGTPMITTKSIDSYRLTDLEEPTDEMLAQIMREAAKDARKANADATKRFFDEIEKMCENVRFP